VVLAGPPNAGKSSLFNALLGVDRALVTEIPGTTRDAIEAPADFHGWPVRLIDTAGLAESEDRLETLGMAMSRRYLGEADLILSCEDGRPGIPTRSPATTSSSFPPRAIFGNPPAPVLLSPP
jgi:tRNA modification GTPase